MRSLEMSFKIRLIFRCGLRTKCAPWSTSVWARLCGQGRANAAKCNAVLPASSLTFGSAPTDSKALTNCGEGNWHAG